MPTTDRPARGPRSTRSRFVRTRGRLPDKRGQAIVELAVILPVMLLLLLAAADLARLFQSRVVVAGAARAGALEAATHPTSWQDGLPCHALTNRVTCAVLTEADGSALTVAPADVDLVCDPSPCSEDLGNVVEVSVVGHFRLINPALAMFTGGQDILLTSTASAQIAVRPNITPSSPTPTPTPSPTPTPTPTPSPTPTPNPSASPTATASATPTPSPSPSLVCLPPIADFVFSPHSGKKKQTEFAFTDMSSTTPECPLTWSWNFGDGAGSASTSTLQNPSHTYQSQGQYTITLVVSTFGGNDGRSRTVTVTP